MIVNDNNLVALLSSGRRMQWAAFIFSLVVTVIFYIMMINFFPSKGFNNSFINAVMSFQSFIFVIGAFFFGFRGSILSTINEKTNLALTSIRALNKFLHTITLLSILFGVIILFSLAWLNNIWVLMLIIFLTLYILFLLLFVSLFTYIIYNEVYF